MWKDQHLCTGMHYATGPLCIVVHVRVCVRASVRVYVCMCLSAIKQSNPFDFAGVVEQRPTGPLSALNLTRSIGNYKHGLDWIRFVKASIALINPISQSTKRDERKIGMRATNKLRCIKTIKHALPIVRRVSVSFEFIYDQFSLVEIQIHQTKLIHQSDGKLWILVFVDTSSIIAHQIIQNHM